MVPRLNPHCRLGPVDYRMEDFPGWRVRSMAGGARVDRLLSRRPAWVEGEEHRRRVAVGAAA